MLYYAKLQIEMLLLSLQTKHTLNNRTWIVNGLDIRNSSAIGGELDNNDKK